MSIRVENVSFEYTSINGKVLALDNVSFTVPTSSFYVITGESGSGKSTLLRLLNGLRTPSEGKIYLDGEDINSPSFPRASLPFRVGLVFQYPESQLFAETVIEDVTFGPMNKGIGKKEALEASKKALLSVGIGEEKWNSSPFSLSGGEKRRVALAGVMAMDPEVLVLDEIAAGLDGWSHQEVFLLLEKERKKGKTIILVSHSADDTAEYGERVLVLSKGKVVEEGETRKVFMNPRVPKGQAERIAEELRRRGMDLPFPILTLQELSQEIERNRG